MPIVQHPTLTVEEILGEPQWANINTRGNVPTLVISVTYDAVFTGQDRSISQFVGFQERIWLEGTLLTLSREGLPVEPGGGGEFQSLPRQHTFLVEKKLVTDQLGVLGGTPLRCVIEVKPGNPLEHKDFTNTVTLPGPTVESPVSTGLLQRAVSWIRDAAIGRWSPEP